MGKLRLKVFAQSHREKTGQGACAGGRGNGVEVHLIVRAELTRGGLSSNSHMRQARRGNRVVACGGHSRCQSAGAGSEIRERKGKLGVAAI